MDINIAFIGNINHINGEFWPMALYASYYPEIVKDHMHISIPYHVFLNNRTYKSFDKVLFNYDRHGNIITCTMIYESSYLYFNIRCPYLYELINDINIIEPQSTKVSERIELNDTSNISENCINKKGSLKLSDSYIPPGFENLSQKDIDNIKEDGHKTPERGGKSSNKLYNTSFHKSKYVK